MVYEVSVFFSGVLGKIGEKHGLLKKRVLWGCFTPTELLTLKVCTEKLSVHKYESWVKQQ